jgi:TctA family transporter
MLEMFITGFAAVLTFKVMALIVLGVVVGIVFGSIPV